MSLAAEFKTLYHLVFARVQGTSHAERLESFYGPQAAHYDGFRRRLLQGREELYRSVPFASCARWVDLGGGTGGNLEFLADRLPQLERMWVVDLSASLLDVAYKRVARHNWRNVELCAADATRFAPPDGPVDVVTCSYSLTMIPDWFAAIDNALRMLRPGGVLAVVDFYIARKFPAANRHAHSWWTRHFWPAWFGMDNVHLSADHVPYLLSRCEPIELVEDHARVPYLPGIRVPYYRFLGRKPTTTTDEPQVELAGSASELTRDA